MKQATSATPAAQPAPPRPYAPHGLRLSVGHETALTLGATLLSVLLLSLIFPPLSLWPLAFCCLTPWTLRVVRAERTSLLYWTSFIGGWLFFLINLYWLMPVTGLGYVALAFYLALYWPLAAWAVRTAQRAGVSPTWSLPVAWVACEYLRAKVMSGFPWLFLSHGLFAQLRFIQVADLGGAYTVTFLAAMLNGLLAEIAGRWIQRKLQPTLGLIPRSAGISCGVLLVGALVYGSIRIAAAEFQPGPRVAVVQEDFPLVSKPPYGAPPPLIFASYLAMAERAVRQRPDLVAFPETTWAAIQNRSFLEVPQQAVEGVSASAWPYGKLCHEATAAFAMGDFARVNQMLDQLERWLKNQSLPRLDPAAAPPTTLLLGSIAVETLTGSSYPRAKRFNSALVYDVDGTQRRERYDKTHLVPFGEIVPFRQQKFMGIDLHPLYTALNGLSPFSEGGNVEYSLWPGQELTVFELNAAGQTYRFGVPICYEDVMPDVVRRFVWGPQGRRVHFLVNISNDGWFQHSAELPQHLAICVFRAVENRVAIARAVNTGISAFIDGNGRISGVVKQDGRARGPGIRGVSVAQVPIDARSSLYGRWGDWFAALCLLLSGLLWAGAVGTRWVASIIQHLASILLKRRRPIDAG